jgi:hypothetical protein
MKTSIKAAFAMLVLTVAALGGCGGGDDPAGGLAPVPVVGATGVVARIDISPPGALFAPGASTHTFQAQAFDAENRPIDATFTWSTNAADVVSVVGDGAHSADATAVKTLGSALITAEANGLKATVFAVAAEPAPGAVLVRDDQIIGLPTPVDAAAAFGPGFQYKVDLTEGVNAPVGTVILSTEAKSVAGRVVSAAGASVTVEQIKLTEAFPHLDIRQTLDLTQASSGGDGPRPTSRSPGDLRPLLEKEFKIGPSIECKLEGSIAAFELTKKDIALSPFKDLNYELAWNDTEKTIVVSGQPKVTFELEAVVKGQVSGTLNCKAILKDYVIPLPGVLGIFLGAAVPIGIGFELGAAAVITQAGVNLKGEAGAKLSFGFRCLDGVCASVTEAETSAAVTPKWIPPELDIANVKFEPQAQVFAWARFEGGARFSSTFRVQAIEAQAGLKLEGSFASESFQASQPDYASSYGLGFEASVGPAGAAASFLKLLDIAVALLKFEKKIPIASSPVGLSLDGAPGTFKAGDDVAFNVALDPTKVKLPVLGYNIESVRIYRKQVGADGKTSLILANEMVPQGEQVNFKIPWVATIDGTVGENFVAFVKTKVLPDLRLEAAATKEFGLAGGLVLPTGEMFPVSDGMFYVDNDGAVVSKASIIFTKLPQGMLVCSKTTQKPDDTIVTLRFNTPGPSIAPGTFTLAQTSLEVGEFQANAQAIGPNCSSSSTTLGWASGTLVMTKASATQMAGTITMKDAAGGTTTGTFSIPSCTKTLAEIGSSVSTCVP